jgi:tetratricopeptide (TPR) repeat protein
MSFAGYTDGMMQKWPLLAWARSIYIIGIFLALVAIIPAAWFPLQLGKLAAFEIALAISGILFVVGGGVGGVFTKRGHRAAFFAALLPLVYLASYAYSTDRSVGLLGYSIESDTVLFSAVCAVAFLFSFFLFRRLSTVRALLGGTLAAAGCALLFQFFSIVLGSKALPSLFADTSVNLVGKWNDVGLLAGAALILMLVALECAPLSRGRRYAAAAAAAVLVLFLALVQFPLIWGLTLGASILLGGWAYLSRTARGTDAGASRVSMMPWFSIGAAALSVIFLLWGAAVQGGLIKVFPVSSLEVRPSLQTTLDVVRASHGDSFGRFLLGTGPQTFSNEWFLNKPLAINQSQFWNLDFNVGYSTLTTALGTVGVLGALAWFIPLVLVLIGLLRIARAKEIFTSEEKLVAGAAGLVSVYLWCSLFMYVPSQNILLLVFTISGAAFAFAMKEADTPAPAVQPNRSHMLMWNGVVALCVLVLVVGVFYTSRRYMAEAYTNQGLISLQQGGVDEALQTADKAMNIERTSDTLQFALLAATTRLQQIAQATSSPSTEVQQQFAAGAQTTIAIGQQAITLNPHDYRAYMAFGRVYDLLNALGVQGAYDMAKGLYTTAVTHNPTNPQIPLTIARLEAAHGNGDATIAALSQSLKLKADYTDAILFAVQLYVANKDINNAIIAAKAAVSSAPGIPAIWFQLGLLYYSANDTANAALAFEQAVKLQNDYANAKYFLGLSYAAQKRTQDAIKQFQDLALSNPDNAEVKLILSNLQQGKAPFDGAQPPVTSTPQGRTTAPISQ